ncbi:TPA: hypothetical protein KFT63_003428 [Escherichia coli]|nr:hypothetical protein [Escherichia coli]
MKRLILLSVMVATLPPYAISAEDISPESLSGKPSSELGDFVYSAMPDAGHGLSWDWQSNSDIVWADGVTQTASGMSLRTGFARINVMGVKSTVLEKGKKELGWEVSLGTSMPAKFGPEYISMAPSKCGGYLNENCTFNPASSLTKRGIEFHKICSTIAGGPNTTDVYIVRVAKKESMLMTWVNSAGSSASSSWLELRMYSPESAALYCDETVKKEYSFATQDGRSKKELVHDTKIITDALSKAISGIDGANDAVCHARIFADGYGGISAFDASQKDNDIVFCESIINRLSGIRLPSPSKNASTIINLDVKN